MCLCMVSISVTSYSSRDRRKKQWNGTEWSCEHLQWERGTQSVLGAAFTARTPSRRRSRGTRRSARTRTARVARWFCGACAQMLSAPLSSVHVGQQPSQHHGPADPPAPHAKGQERRTAAARWRQTRGAPGAAPRPAAEPGRPGRSLAGQQPWQHGWALIPWQISFCATMHSFPTLAILLLFSGLSSGPCSFPIIWEFHSFSSVCS